MRLLSSAPGEQGQVGSPGLQIQVGAGPESPRPHLLRALETTSSSSLVDIGLRTPGHCSWPWEEFWISSAVPPGNWTPSESPSGAASPCCTYGAGTAVEVARRLLGEEYPNEDMPVINSSFLFPVKPKLHLEKILNWNQVSAVNIWPYLTTEEVVSPAENAPFLETQQGQGGGVCWGLCSNDFSWQQSRVYRCGSCLWGHVNAGALG